MSYGLSPYGLSPYGGITPNLFVVNAFPISTNTLRVTFSKEPQNISPQLVGDILNTRTWKIIRNDTNTGFNILYINKVNSQTWDVTVLEQFGTINIEHTVTLATLLDVGGSQIDSPNFILFKGILESAKSSNDRKSSKRGFVLTDIESPPAPSGLNSIGGVYVIRGGDWNLHEGEKLIEKLIIRRITTPRGAFRAIGLINYGLGLRVKEPLPAAEIVKFQADAINEIKQEPEVAEAAVRVEQDKNAFTIFVAARLKAVDRPLSFSVPIPFVNL